MKIKDLIQKLLEHDWNEDVHVEVCNPSNNTRATVEIFDVLRMNDEANPHVGIVADYKGPLNQKAVQAIVEYSEARGWEIHSR